VVHPIASHRGCVQSEVEVVETFDVIHSSQTKSWGLRWGSWVYDSKLDMFSEQIQARIRSYATQSDNSISFDLDCQKVYGLDFGVLHLNKEYFYSMQRGVAKWCEITVTFSSNEVRTNFSDYASLRRWIEHPIRKIYPASLKSSLSCQTARIVLGFDAEHDTGLVDLRIEITSFIRLTYDLLAQSIILICIKTRGSESKHEHAVSLETIRKRCFLFISKIMESCPAKRYQQCPQLWINGYGTVLGAVEQGIDSSQHGAIQVNPHANLDDTDLSNIGCNYATTLERRLWPIRPTLKRLFKDSGEVNNVVKLQEYHFHQGRRINHALRECEDLGSMWISLKDLDWTA
jgi:hypothetical protein